MKFNELAYDDLVKLLNFTLDYFKQDVNYKIANGDMKGTMIESIGLVSKEEEMFFMEGIVINGNEILPVAYGKGYFELNNEKYETYKFRELLTYITIWGLQAIYESEYLKVPVHTAQINKSWGISEIN